MTLKKFAGPKSIELIRAQCLLRNLVCDSTLFDQGRSDYIIVFSPAAPLAKVFYKDINGHFFGTTDQGGMFDSAQPLDDEPWFIALLEFFYESLPAGAALETAASSGAIAQLHDQAFAAAQAVPPESLAAAQAVIRAAVIEGSGIAALESNLAAVLQAEDHSSPQESLAEKAGPCFESEK